MKSRGTAGCRRTSTLRTLCFWHLHEARAAVVHHEVVKVEADDLKTSPFQSFSPGVNGHKLYAEEVDDRSGQEFEHVVPHCSSHFVPALMILYSSIMQL